jgi:hypothetical protein
MRNEIELGEEIEVVGVDNEEFRVMAINIAPYLYTFLDIDNLSRVSDRCIFTWNEEMNMDFVHTARLALGRAGFTIG